MVMGYRLPGLIIKKSISSNWDDAKKEWKVLNMYYIEDPEREGYDTCLCGHYPIREVLILSNINTFQNVIIGNCCVNKFFEITDYNKVFKALSRGKINKAILEIALDKSIITELEFNFSCDVWRKRSLSSKQSAWLNKIKTKIFMDLKI